MPNIDFITEIRSFNRFYTDLLGLLDRHILDSGYSLTEARVLFEISKSTHCTAKQLCQALAIDRSYMSRILARFEKEDLITRHPLPADRRNAEIQLTSQGLEAFQALDDRSNQQIGALLEKLGEEDTEALMAAIRTVKQAFLRATKPLTVRPFRQEDIDYVIDRQLSLYAAERQFTTETWTDYLIEGVHAFADNFDPEKDAMLILECDGAPAGCIAIAHSPEGSAQLRYFFLEPELRGMGAGSNLVNMALDLCREKGYQQVFLWTVSAQTSARALYASAGFVITETEENSAWGVPVVEEKWELAL